MSLCALKPCALHLFSLQGWFLPSAVFKNRCSFTDHLLLLSAIEKQLGKESVLYGV